MKTWYLTEFYRKKTNQYIIITFIKNRKCKISFHLQITQNFIHIDKYSNDKKKTSIQYLSI